MLDVIATSAQLAAEQADEGEPAEADLAEPAEGCLRSKASMTLGCNGLGLASVVWVRP